MTSGWSKARSWAQARFVLRHRGQAPGEIKSMEEEARVIEDEGSVDEISGFSSAAE